MKDSTDKKRAENLHGSFYTQKEWDSNWQKLYYYNYKNKNPPSGWGAEFLADQFKQNRRLKSAKKQEKNGGYTQVNTIESSQVHWVEITE